MRVPTNDMIAAVATVVTDGNIEIVEHAPFAARLFGLGAPVQLQTFFHQPTETTVLDLMIPVAKLPCCADLDHWIARVAPGLFNVHVAARDVEDGTIVEVRSTVVAEGLTVDLLERVLSLLMAGATSVADALRTDITRARQLTSGPRSAASGYIVQPTASINSLPTQQAGSPPCFPGYL